MVRLVLEGGSFRGLYTAGILDVFMDNNIEIDEIVGVSAGALFGVNYYSKQRGRVIRYNKKYCGDKRFMSIRSLIFTGNYINKNFAYYKVTKKLDPFDEETFKKNNKKFYAVVTNVETGKPEYLKIKKPIEDIEKLRATSAIPLVSKIIKVNGKKYLDGGISDSIPIFYNKDKYEKNIIILTQMKGYKKDAISKSKERLIKFKYKKYPKLIETMLNRYKKYNETLKQIEELEENGEVFVFRPNKKLDIKLSESNPEKFEEIYNVGVKVAKQNIIN